MEISPELLFSLVYILTAVCFVFPPKEFTSAGLTVQNLFASYLGSEQLHFISYHVKRTTITVMVHSVIPLGFYIGLGLVSPELCLFNPYEVSMTFAVIFLSCTLILLLGLTVASIWLWKRWKHHPVVRVLSAHGSPWQDVAAQINIEFRRFNKFSSLTGGCCVYVTDSWIIKCGAYFIDVAQQTDCHLSLSSSEEYAVFHETNQPTQFLRIKVYSTNPSVKPFEIRLNAMEYSDLKDKLQAPLRNARNVVIHQSMGERFLVAFQSQVEVNGQVPFDGRMDELDPCIGCMQKRPDVKLQKSCVDGGDGECMRCYCRPMWCLECMGKWYASRQDQNHPETWMGSTAPCPTCRARFCMLDVKGLAVG